MGIELFGLLILGFSASVLAYLLGIGGGALIVPVMTVFFGYPVHEAIAASLVVIVISSLSLTSVNLLKNMVNIRFALFMESMAVAGAFMGGMITVSISQKSVSMVFAATMFLTAYLMYNSKGEDTSLAEKPEKTSEFDNDYYDAVEGRMKYYTVKKPYATGSVAGFAGLASGMLGLGGGVFMVPAMNILARMPIKAATATSNFMVCFTSASASIPYLLKGYLHPAATATMVIGAVMGSKFSTSKLTKVKSRKIRLMFIFFVLYVALQMLYESVML
ncbi:MAG: sulfite exporter TauE/SafE family protein [Deferribacterales bacterium]